MSNKWSLTSDFFGGPSENFSEEALLVEEASEDEDLEDWAEDEQDEVDGRPKSHPVTDGLGVVKVPPLNSRQLEVDDEIFRRNTIWLLW